MLLFWVEPRVNPEQLARSLLDEMELTPIDIGITPKGPDAMALVAPIGLLLGRLANFINAELWGRPTTMPWGVIFPGEAAQTERRWAEYFFANGSAEGLWPPPAVLQAPYRAAAPWHPPTRRSGRWRQTVPSC